MSILGKILLLVAAFALGGWTGREWQLGVQARQENARQINQRATERLRRQNADTAATAHEADKTAILTKFIPITTEVERVVTQVEYRDRACFDPDGVRVLNAAIAASGDPAVPGNPMPGASAPR